MSINLCYDNKEDVYFANNQVYQEKTKYIEIDCHFIQKKIENKEITTPFVRSHDLLADILLNQLSKSTSSYLFQAWFV